MRPPKTVVLVLSMGPYRYATRTRKAADSYAEVVPTRFLALQGVGRTGKRDRAGVSVSGALTIQQVRVREPLTGSGRRGAIVNLAVCYLPGFLRLAAAMLLTPAEVVHVTGAPLAPLGFLHRVIYRSRLLLDINERPASVSASDSVFSVVARLEPRILGIGSRLATITTVVAPGHAEILEREHGFSNVEVVMNCPDAQWRPPFVESTRSDSRLRVVTVGSIFERRAYELMINATAVAIGEGLDIDLSIYGYGRPDYLASLQTLIDERGVGHNVRLAGSLDRERVAAAYASADVGLALYEPVDAGNDSLSNKIIEVVCAGRPVIAGRLSENERFIDEHRVGWLTDLSVEGVAEAFALAAVEATPELARHCYDVGTEVLTWDAGFNPVRDSILRAN